jgi:hypothetical protein
VIFRFDWPTGDGEHGPFFLFSAPKAPYRIFSPFDEKKEIAGFIIILEFLDNIL